MENSLEVLVNYVSENPLKGDSPKVYLFNGDNNKDYRVEFIDSNSGQIVTSYICKNNSLVTGLRQWYIDWEIKVYDNSNNYVIYSEKYTPKNKTVFIKMDAFALGDNIAWIPYIEEFRKKHNCIVICSTFYNYIFQNVYPNILFIQPNINIANVYSQYYVGASSKNISYSPVDYENNSLQRVASSILGLEDKEIRPRLEGNVHNSKPRIEGKYVCISEFASHEKKHWKEVDGWQKVVNFLNEKGYKVAVISRESTSLKNIIDLTGDVNLFERMIDLYHSAFFMGVSSGLSWLAWSLNKKVVTISDCTPSWCEFVENNFRVIKNELNSINYDIEEHSSYEDVIKALSLLM